MQSKLKFSFALLLTLLLYAFRSVAQEGQTPQEFRDLNQHPELNLNDDKTLIMEPEGKLNKTQSSREANNTGATAKQKSENTNKAPANEKKQDPLSFNFLYFIIEKFKVSDIVDE